MRHVLTRSNPIARVLTDVMDFVVPILPGFPEEEGDYRRVAPFCAVPVGRTPTAGRRLHGNEE